MLKTDETTLAEVFLAYADCALWSSTDDDGNPLDARFDVGDISRHSRESMREDCRDFLTANAKLIEESDLTPEQVGHDFWLTRNGHGAGFWDRGLGRVGDELTAMAKPYGESCLYVGDGNRVYVDGSN